MKHLFGDLGVWIVFCIRIKIPCGWLLFNSWGNCLPDIISWNCFETASIISYIPFLWRSSHSLSECCMLGGLAFSYLIIAQGYFLLDKRVYIHVSKSSIWCFLSQRLILCDVLLPLSELIVYFLFSK